MIDQSQDTSAASEVAVEVTARPEQLSPVDVSISISIVVNLLAEEALNNSKVPRLEKGKCHALRISSFFIM